MRETDCDPRRTVKGGIWTVETCDDALLRTPLFGRRFFEDLFAQFPEAAAAATFLRWSVQPDDTYAVFSWPKGGFGAQIDPDLDYIIVWDPGGQAEYGHWDGDPVPLAIEHVRRVVLAAT
jgi:hypothetical protein